MAGRFSAFKTWFAGAFSVGGSARRRVSKGFRWKGFLYGIGATAAVLFLGYQEPPALARLNDAAFDFYQTQKPRTYDPDIPVRVIDIDTESLKRYGQWPWPRTYVAELIDRLSRLGAGAIAFDILFAEPDRTSPAIVVESWRRFGGIDAGVELDSSALPDHDAYFADQIGGSPVVLGTMLGNTPNDARPPRKSGVSFASGNPEWNPIGQLEPFAGADVNLPALAEHALGVGNLSLGAGRGDVVRKVPMLARVGDQIVPSLSLEAIRVGTGAGSVIVRANDASGQFAGGGETKIESIKIGPVIVPVSEDGSLYAYFSGRQEPRSIPAWKIMEGDDIDLLLQSQIAGHVVFIGSGAPGLQDIVATPLNDTELGVVVHAELAEQMLGAFLRDSGPSKADLEAALPQYDEAIAGETDEDVLFTLRSERETVQAMIDGFDAPFFLARPDYIFGLERAFVVIFGLMVAGLIAMGYAGLAATSALVGGAGVAAVCWWAFDRHGLLVGPVLPALGVIAPYAVGTIFNYLEADRDKRAVRSQFAHFMSPDVIDEIAGDPERYLTPGGDRRPLSILFCDVRSFSTITEKMTPEETILFINDFLTPLTDEILSQGGTIDKYMGDAIMAFWNAPKKYDDHEDRACRAILNFQDALVEINKVFAARGTPEIAIGVGVNTGPCAVGAMGSKSRLDYSCIGDAVNLASRLEGITKQYGLWNCIGNETAEAVRERFALIEIDQVAVKGRTQPERIWTVLGDAPTLTDPGYLAMKAAVDRGLAAYRAQDWDAAEAAYREAGAMEFPSLKAAGLAGAFLGRVAEYKIAPPPADWDGVYVATSK